jgi:hypothetical protein
MSKSTFTQFNKFNPCPICYNNRACKVDPFNNNLHLCIKGREDTTDFVFRGMDRTGEWGIFFPNNCATSSSALKTFKRTARQNPQELIVKQDLESYKTDLTKFFKNQPLKSEHETKLLVRGLTSEAIQRIKYCSINQYDKVQGATSFFPGFKPDGQFVGATGMLIPALDMFGNVQGYQIAPDKLVNGNKYLWATVRGDLDIPLNNYQIRLEHLEGSPLEAPLHHSIVSYEKKQPLYLTEGYLKPQVASHKLGVNILGFVGGNWQSCKAQLKEAIAFLNPSCVLWLADTGSCLNPNVWQKVYKLSQHIAVNYSIPFNVVDWGQLEQPKTEKLDCDEIDKKRFYSSKLTPYFECGGASTQEAMKDKCKKEFKGFCKTLSRVNAINKKQLENRKGTVSYLKVRRVIPFLNAVAVDKKDLSYTHTFKQEERLEVYQKCVGSSIKYWLDSSPMGSGKSYAVGLWNTSDFLTSALENPTRLYHLTAQHRYPTTPTLEDNFAEYPTKHEGLFAHQSKLTPNGKPVYMRSKHPDSKTQIAANCSFYGKQEALMQANASSQSICRTCPIKPECAKGSEPGSHGFLFEQKEVMANNTRIRANLKGLNPKLINDSDIAFIDEASKAVEFINTLDVPLWQIQEALPRFRSILGEEDFKLLDPLVLYLNGEGKYYSHNEKLYGKAGYQYLEDNGGEQPALLHASHKIGELEAEINKERFDSKAAPILEFGMLLFQALSGLSPDVSFSIRRGFVTLNSRNLNVLESISLFNTVFFQDATMSKDELARSLGVEPKEIGVVSQAQPDDVYKNTIVWQIQDLGAVGACRTNDTLENMGVVREVFQQRFGLDVGFIEKKVFSKEGDLNHFSDARGSNAFESKTAMVVFGTPRMNLSAARRKFEVLYGRLCQDKDPEFDVYYETITQAELLQEVGRLRSVRRPNQKLDIYFVNNADLNFLTDHGFRVVQVSGGEISETLDNNHNRFIKRLLRLKLNEGMDFSKLTVRKIAELAEVATTTVYEQIKYYQNFEGGNGGTGDWVEQFLNDVIADPMLFAYYTNALLSMGNDDDSRKEIVSTILYGIAVIKEAMRDKTILDSMFAEEIARKAWELGVELNTFVERQLTS